MLYGHNKTIHGTRLLNVEVDKDGKVVSVWFRCMALPFDQSIVNEDRAEEMRKMSGEIKHEIVAIEIINDDDHYIPPNMADLNLPDSEEREV